MFLVFIGIKKQRVISKKLLVAFGDSDELNQRLLKMIRKAEDLVLLAKKVNHVDPILFLKQHFYSELSTKEIEEKQKNIQGELGEIKLSDNLVTGSLILIWRTALVNEIVFIREGKSVVSASIE